MGHKNLASTILLTLIVSSTLIVSAPQPETIKPLADAFVDAFSLTENFGYADHLEVSDCSRGLCLAFLMFDLSEVSHVPNASSEIKLHLYCFYVASPHIIGVRWCVNNTWKEENLTFTSLSGFNRTLPESAVRVEAKEKWYEWKVTNLVSKAMEENNDKITLTLEIEDALEGEARSLYASKDQEWPRYSPQLVFTYTEHTPNPLNVIAPVMLGLAVIGAIIFLAYKFLKRPKTRHRKKRPYPK
jgi:hypothetical protein